MSQIIAESNDTYGSQSIFVINDITLSIPPTNIVIQKDDLTYSWRTLRSKASTKIPSGHANVNVQVVIPFKYSQILDLHRLIVELRHSPFCYVDNAFIREALVPDWADSQNMAFTATSINIAPMPGVSDVFVAQLDLVWFNYFCYTQNWLYRQEWETDWVTTGAGDSYRWSIYWSMLEGEKIHGHSITDTRTAAEGGIAEWSAIQEKFSTTPFSQRTIQLMEQAHRGEIFDLLPAPDRMAAAVSVTMPVQSRIYVRFINLLQRDALLQNFGIDIESDLGEHTDLFFGSVRDDYGKRRTLCLNNFSAGQAWSNPLDNPFSGLEEAYRVWHAARQGWVNQIISHARGVTFHFHSYRDIKPPQNLTKRLQAVNLALMKEARPELLGFIEDGQREYITAVALNQNTGKAGDPVARIRVRRGFHYAGGKSSVIGDGVKPYSIERLVKGKKDILRWRGSEEWGMSYVRTPTGIIKCLGRRHMGTDFGFGLGSSVHAVAAGTVSRITRYNERGSWIVGLYDKAKKKVHWHTSIADANKQIQTDYSDFDGLDFEEVLYKVVNARDPSAANQLSASRDINTLPYGVGTLLSQDLVALYDLELPGSRLAPKVSVPVGRLHVLFFHQPNSAGNYITIEHNDGKSLYMHLDEIKVERGASVEAGQIIGTIGSSGPFELDPNTLSNIVVDGSGVVEHLDHTLVNWKFGNHLHFEFWEKRSVRNDSKLPDDVPEDQRSARDQYVAVDPLPSYSRARDLQATVIDEITGLDAAATEQEIEEFEEKAKEIDNDPKELQAWFELIYAMYDEGWHLYEEDSQVCNVWQRLYTLQITPTNTEDPITEALYHDDAAVLTGISGGLRHIVANIPILGQQYPTQQHLGSIEPHYAMEFACLDTENLDGLGETGALLHSIHSIMQHNARKFRIITDSWCVGADTLLTRLLGTYRLDDYQIERGDLDLSVPEGETVSPYGSVIDHRIRKRSTIATMSTQNLEGHPGVSTLNMELWETNPYEQQSLNAVSGDLFDREQAREDVLKALVDLKFADDEHSELIITALIAKHAGADLSYIDADAYGKFNITETTSLKWMDSKWWRGQDQDLGVAAIYGPQWRDEVPSLNFRGDQDQLETWQTLLDSYGIGSDLLEQNDEHYLIVPSDVVASKLPTLSEELKGKGSGRTNDINGFEGDSRAYKSHEVDLTSYLNTDEAMQLTQYPVEDILKFRVVALSIMNTAEMLLAEPSALLDKGHMSGGGLELSEVKNALYDLDVEPRMWRTWQAMLVRLARQATSGVLSQSADDGENWIKDDNWLEWTEKLTATEIAGINNADLSWFDDPITWMVTTARLLPQFMMLELLWEGVVDIGNGRFPENVLADYYKDLIDGCNSWIVKHYFEMLPLKSVMRYEYFGSILNQSLIGDLIGGITGKDKSPVFQTASTTLLRSLNSSVRFSLSITGRPSLSTSPDARNFELSGPQYDAVTSIVDKLDDSELPQGFGRAGDPWLWEVAVAAERQRLNHFKDLLAKLADRILRRPDMLAAFGLGKYNSLVTSNRIRGSDAYPDLDLPAHPYYMDATNTSPDFYMWNIYQDGGALTDSIRADVTDSMNFVIERCYKSMKRMQQGEEDYNPAKDKYVVEANIDASDPIELKSQLLAEGSDTGPRGGMASPFYLDNKTESYINDWNSQKEVTGEMKSLLPPLGEGPGGKYPCLRVSNTEGPYGVGGGTLYPNRMAASEYERLAKEVNGLKSMFGSRAGYLAQKDLAEERGSAVEGMAVDTTDTFKHGFDPEFLKKLAAQSSQDVLSERMTVRRAYPTFKLFFVEEDEFENRLLNFDDFYSYNGVREFSVVSSRKMPADTAVIVLQNISGVLDGTKRDAITDLDYFSRSITKQVEKPGVAAADDPVVQDTVQDQPFGAVVLRPGLNVQLRAGYSNDPDNLQVLISGRIVDVQWNKDGDVAEILVQGFGAELMQVTKGISYGQKDAELYYTTHQLLGSLMLEPEVVHFGRWEFGQLYQLHENNDARLDFHDYSREGFLGKFKYTSAAVRWVSDNPLLVGLALGFGYLLLTYGKVPGLGKLTRNLSKTTFGAKIVSRLSLKAASRGLVLGWGEAGFAKVISSGGAAAAIERQVVRHFGNIARAFVKYAPRSTRLPAALLEARKVAIAQFRARLAAGRLAGAASGGITARALARVEKDFIMALHKAMWKTRPFTATQGFFGFLSGTGIKPAKRLYTSFLKYPKALLGAAGVGVGLDALSATWKPVHDATLGRIQNYFQATQSSIMLSPQDDNLFPPHPKDYMTMNDSWWKDLKTWAVHVGASALSFSSEGGDWARRWYRNKDDPFDKYVEPQACHYKMEHTTIWDVFHEMSLRHPGWVYAVRPYGNRFRCTMFFGVPSQRYWSRPANNEFVLRSIRLAEMLEANETISLEQFKMLYGEVIPERGTNVNEAMDKILNIVHTDGTKRGLDSQQIQDIFKRTSEKFLTGVALKEYVQTLQLRFTPFRRYHLIDSDVNLVWNGIMGTENAMYNGVAVTYRDEDDEHGNDNVPRTQLFKAHPFIPEYKLRVLPLSDYSNCRGFGMAMRYAMGSLMHTMKDMYRGELIILGNARIRPWDMAILIDNYNDMVGPVEVEQVVHNFSHQTGWITEVKPSAVVFGNEISSWPVLEAMKVASLAIKDIETSFIGLRAEDLGVSETLTNLYLRFAQVNEEGTEFTTAMAQRKAERFGTEWDPAEKLFGSNAPDLSVVDEIGSETKDVMLGLLGAGAIAGAGFAAFGAGNMAQLIRSGMGGWKNVSRPAAQIIGGLGIAGILGGTAFTFSSAVKPPSSAWLVGGFLLFLSCLPGDTIVVVPLLKNGQPIVAGLTLKEPSMIWNNFVGDLRRYTTDIMDGTRDVLELWHTYKDHVWHRLPEKTVWENVASGFSDTALDKNDIEQSSNRTGI
jgi:murein DD-endopeptidase MepM/ murein hydrolase activator NlpD